MDVFHVVIDSSVLRSTHLQHPEFFRLLRRSQMGALKIYIPHIVLEEERTNLLHSLQDAVKATVDSYDKVRRGPYAMLLAGLPEPNLTLWDMQDVERNSREVFDRYLADNKIEKLDIAPEHGPAAWERYFSVAPPFARSESRMNRRKDIPDSWILVAALGLKAKPGRHCALVADNKLKDALANEGFEIFTDVDSLDRVVEESTALASSKLDIPERAAVTLEQLRAPAFDNLAVVILGMIEALDTPAKEDLFAQLERAGVNRELAEHEARTLVLSGRLQDTGTRFIPKDRDLARQAMESQAVVDTLMKIL